MNKIYSFNKKICISDLGREAIVIDLDEGLYYSFSGVIKDFILSLEERKNIQVDELSYKFLESDINFLITKGLIDCVDVVSKSTYLFSLNTSIEYISAMHPLGAIVDNTLVGGPGTGSSGI